MCQAGRRRPRWRSSATVGNWFHRCLIAGLILRPQTGSAASKMRYRFCVQKTDAISVPRNARRNIFFSSRPDLRYRNRVHFLALESVPHAGNGGTTLRPQNRSRVRTAVGPIFRVRQKPPPSFKVAAFPAYSEALALVLWWFGVRACVGAGCLVNVISRKLRWPRFLTFSCLAW